MARKGVRHAALSRAEKNESPAGRGLRACDARFPAEVPLWRTKPAADALRLLTCSRANREVYRTRRVALSGFYYVRVVYPEIIEVISAALSAAASSGSRKTRYISHPDFQHGGYIKPRHSDHAPPDRVGRSPVKEARPAIWRGPGNYTICNIPNPYDIPCRGYKRREETL